MYRQQTDLPRKIGDGEIDKEINVMVVEVVKLNMHRVWNKCVEKQWYTRGTNEEYDKMLNMTKEP